MSADTKPSIGEMAESLTGYDEIGIEKAFGADPTELTGNKSIRALAFVHFKRQGQTHDEAYDAAMSLGIKAVTELFADDEDEVMPEEPETASGKDDSQPSEQQTNSLPSAS